MPKRRRRDDATSPRKRPRAPAALRHAVRAHFSAPHGADRYTGVVITLDTLAERPMSECRNGGGGDEAALLEGDTLDVSGLPAGQAFWALLRINRLALAVLLDHPDLGWAHSPAHVAASDDALAAPTVDAAAAAWAAGARTRD